jgi:hypothetical protein
MNAGADTTNTPFAFQGFGRLSRKTFFVGGPGAQKSGVRRKKRRPRLGSLHRVQLAFVMLARRLLSSALRQRSAMRAAAVRSDVRPVFVFVFVLLLLLLQCVRPCELLVECQLFLTHGCSIPLLGRCIRCPLILS